MLSAALEMLCCPHCGGALAEHDGALACPEGHGFDLAHQGYVNLLAGPAPSAGDSAAMVAARETFLAAGHFDPISSAMAAEAERRLGEGSVEGGIVDAGGGTGHHLAVVLDRLPGRAGVCLDLSRYAARRAARAHPRAAAAVCDVWAGLPVRDGAAVLVLSVFAPRNGPELERILAPGGSVLVAAPTPRHLRELVEPLGLVTVDERKRERVVAALAPLRLGASREVEYELSLNPAELEQLVAMGPSAHHLDPASLGERLAELSRAPVTVSVEFAVFGGRRALG